MRARPTVTGLVLALALVAGCRAALRPAMPVTPTAPPLARVARHPPLVDDADLSTLTAAIRASIEFYGRLPAERTFAFGADRVTAARMREALIGLVGLLDTRPTAAELARELDRRFEIYRATAEPAVLYTGYYLPVVAARAAADASFRFPVLARPPDLVTASPSELGTACAAGVTLTGRVERGRLAPYPTRAEIEATAAGSIPATPVLAWVDDPVALFFLQIQGTGRLAFPDGDTRLIGFAASNGRPYVSVGKLLVGEGQLSADAASMQGIRSWIAAHPDQRERVLHANPRYVFFRPLAGEPLGSLGVPVTAGRTIATDPAIYPPGALAFVRVPPSPTASTDTLSRMMLNQDAGGAIGGPARVDVFFGEGREAETHAGRLRNNGELYFLAPRQNAG